MKPILKNLLVEAWLPILLLVCWWFLSAGSTSLYFPPLQDILRRFSEVWLSEQGLVHLVPSLSNLLFGLVIALFLAIIVGTVLGLMPKLADAFYPVLELARATPVLALLPLVIALLGIDATSKIVLIAFGAFWPTMLNTIDGVRSVDPQVREMARTFSLSWRTVVGRVVLPSASPQIIVGVRTSVSIAVVVMVGTELFGATAGIGYYVLQSQRTYAITDMWAGLVMLGLIGYLLNLIAAMVEARVLRWHRGLHGVALTTSTKSKSP